MTFIFYDIMQKTIKSVFEVKASVPNFDFIIV